MFPILNPPPSPYHPSGSPQCTSPKHPVSCIEPGLATRFIHDIIHVSMPFSQIFPPSPSPTECVRLIYTSVSLLLSPTQGYCYHRLLVSCVIQWVIICNYHYYYFDTQTVSPFKLFCILLTCPCHSLRT